MSRRRGRPVTVDAPSREQVLERFKQLDKKRMKSAYRLALRKSGKVLSDKAKYYLRLITPAYNHRNWWDGKTLQAGIMVSVDRDIEYATIHILGDYRLKFFQDGTVRRKTLGRRTAGMRASRLKTNRIVTKGKNRGEMPERDFFVAARCAVEDNMQSVLNKAINDSINKVWHRG